MFDQDAAYARTNDDLPAKVSFTVGGDETPDGFRRRLEQLAPDLPSQDGSRARPGEYHETAVPTNLSR